MSDAQEALGAAEEVAKTSETLMGRRWIAGIGLCAAVALLVLGFLFRGELLYFCYIPPLFEATSNRRLKMYEGMRHHRSRLRDRRIKETLASEYRRNRHAFENDRVAAGPGYLNLLACGHYLDNVAFSAQEIPKWLVQYELIQKWTLQTRIAREIHGLPPLPEGSAAKIDPGKHTDKIGKKELNYMQWNNLVYTMAVIHDVHGTKGWLEGRRDYHQTEGNRFWADYYDGVLGLVDWEGYGARTPPEREAILNEYLQGRSGR
jgi:hypothetical protein